MATVQAVDRIPAILADLFADVPYVKKLGYSVDGSNAILRATFDDGGSDKEYATRFDAVVDKMGEFEDAMVGGIMPDIELRTMAVEEQRSWPDMFAGLRVVIDR